MITISIITGRPIILVRLRKNMTQYEIEKVRRENEELKRKLREEEAKRAEETAMAMIWGRSRTRGMRMELGAEAALGELF